MITREQSNTLKAIAIISIMLCHFWGWIEAPAEIVERVFGGCSQAGVFIFLFLSGYGLKSSYDAVGLQFFWKKRLEKIYIPLLIVTIPQFIWLVWSYRSHIQDMYLVSTCLSVVGLFPNNILDGTLWFIPFILLQYIVFYFVYKYQFQKDSFRLLLLALGTLFVYAIFKKYFTWVNSCDEYGFAFLLGILYKTYWENKINQKVMLCATCIGLCVSIMLGGYSSVRLLYVISLIVLEVSCVSVLNIKCKFIDFIGCYSYELYLTEGIFFWHKIIYDKIGYNYLAFAIHWLVILVLAFLLKKITVAVRQRWANAGNIKKMTWIKS